MKVTILGCGTSSGVPRVGGDGNDGDWGACDPAEPRNRRRRVSILVESGDTRILVDTTPDLREQLLGAGIGWLSAVIWTHDHADHVHGLDDLRPLFHRMGRPVPGYARPNTAAVLRRRFGYVFSGEPGYPAIATLDALGDDMAIGDIRLRVTDQPHGGITSAGLRFDSRGKSVVYATDFNRMTDDMQSLYQGCDLWIVDALRRAPHPTHAHLDDVLRWIAEVRPGRALLTHMDNSMDYRTLCAELPEGMAPAYDGQQLVLG